MAKQIEGREGQSAGRTGAAPAHVAILMAVYDGAPTLPEQLASLAAQDHTDWQLIASDDGSSDDSRAVLARFAKGRDTHKVHSLDGPGRGAAQNFLFLIRQAAALCPPDSWLAFSDQDDVWLPDRLSRGLAALSAGAAEQPALYCSRTWITDDRLGGRRLSPPRPQPPGLRNALVQNIAAGNTILLNPAGARLVMAAAAEVTDVVVHDWWVYLLITAAGGRVVHDDEPTLLYRQHAENQIGANDHLRARLKRIAMILTGTWRKWNNINAAALLASEARLAPEGRDLVMRFQAMRASWLLPRLWRLGRLGLYRQTRASTLALWFAALLGRI